ncbi:MAG: class I tRNA ligase family protein, partial [Myxococcales bacterium]|nr:class I tRNA ligase family protein [Myxococcales bacterium]
MSKTKGNVVDPLVVIDQWGADAFRFTLVAFAAQGRDVLWDEKRVEGYHRFSTKIWQALRYCFLQADGYDPDGPMAFGPYEDWIRARTGAAVANVRRALDEYKFNEAATEVYAFAWNELCDWYIELSKATIYDESATFEQKNAVKHTLFETMAVLVRLLHPMMPFFTEEIWSLLPEAIREGEGFVATAPYPQADDYPSDPAVLSEIALLQDLITEIRRIRGEMEIALKVDLVVRVGEEPLYAILQAHERAVWDAVKCRVVLSREVPSFAATGVVSGHKLVIPLEGVVDRDAERSRLDKELTKVVKDVDQLERRLANPGFVDRAPAEVVQEFRDKLDAARQRKDTLAAARARLEAP